MPACIAQLLPVARCYVGRGPGNAVDGVGGRCLGKVVSAPADDVARARLDRAAVVTARRDVGRGARNAVDGIGGCGLAIVDLAPADDVARARLDRAAGKGARRDIGRGPPGAVDGGGGVAWPRLSKPQPTTHPVVVGVGVGPAWATAGKTVTASATITRNPTTERRIVAFDTVLLLVCEA